MRIFFGLKMSSQRGGQVMRTIMMEVFTSFEPMNVRLFQRRFVSVNFEESLSYFPTSTSTRSTGWGSLSIILLIAKRMRRWRNVNIQAKVVQTQENIKNLSLMLKMRALQILWILTSRKCRKWDGQVEMKLLSTASIEHSMKCVEINFLWLSVVGREIYLSHDFLYTFLWTSIIRVCGI